MSDKDARIGAMPQPIVSFGGRFSTVETNAILASVSRVLLERVPAAERQADWVTITDCIGSGDFSRLCLYDPDVLDQSATSQSLIYQVLAFFRKRDDIDLGIDRDAVALAKFRESEAVCALLNERFESWKRGKFVFSPEAEAVLHRSAQKISRVLYPKEDTEPPTWETIRPRFGPGGSTQTPKRKACIVNKLIHAPSRTNNFSQATAAYDTVFMGEEAEGEASLGVPQICAAKLCFVSKNAKTSRSIVTEPALNSMFQIGLGELMADYLRKGAGIDIRDQTRNQMGAKAASIDGLSATIDLSSASDTVSLGLVEHLLPYDWFNLIRQLRSRSVTREYKDQKGNLREETLVMQKVSSMGNGFTFPLETLIFWAISDSVVDIYHPQGHAKSKTLVYGDDIIVPSTVATRLMAILYELGFTPNAEKSFWTGTFRESCGHDYVLGTNVRPVFVTDRLSGADMFRLHNFFKARADAELACFFEKLIHPSIRLRGPKGYGDGHLHADVWVARPVGRKKGWSGFSFQSWTKSPKIMEREMAERFVEMDQCSYPRKIVWKARCFALVRRLATYVTYRRETENPESYKDIRDVAGDREMPCPRIITDGAHFTLPVTVAEEGEFDPDVDTAVRTKVYVFEPPFLKQ